MVFNLERERGIIYNPISFDVFIENVLNRWLLLGFFKSEFMDYKYANFINLD